MQLCALFSQLHEHIEALDQAKQSVKLTHLMIKDLHSLCDFYTEKDLLVRSEHSTINDTSTNNDISITHSASEVPDDSQITPNVELMDTQTAIVTSAHN